MAGPTIIQPLLISNFKPMVDEGFTASHVSPPMANGHQIPGFGPVPGPRPWMTTECPTIPLRSALLPRSAPLR